MITEEKFILFEYEVYCEKEYNPISYAEFVTKKLIEAREELSKLHQPTVSGRSEQLCQCKDAPTKHFIKNWCDDCKKHIV